MISFKESLERKQKVFKQIINAGMKNAADCGCGTGVDSVALSRLGLNVTAFDPSSEMILQAKTNAELAGEKINFNIHPISEIPSAFNNRFDLVVSFGNTFANIKRQDFNDSIKKAFKLLRSGGLLFIHILNYQKILKEKNRIVNITEGKENYFIRFYDFERDKINFNILTFNRSNRSEHKLITTEVFPYSKEDFQNSLRDSGFIQIETYSNLKFDKFNNDDSKELFIKAARK
jgi:ubiquinone/menaquinone biosynthesis C-methylase UbiE